MFRFVTAAFGEPYFLSIRGLLRSFAQFAPEEKVIVFTDMASRLSGAEIVPVDYSELVSDLDPFFQQTNGQFRNVSRYVLLKKAQEMYPDDDLCWIDADMLVLRPLSGHLLRGQVNVMAHGRRDDQVLDCGGGLTVPGTRYAIGGMNSFPPGPAIDYLLQTVRELPTWPDEGGPNRSMSSQLVLNHLVARSGLPVNWLTDDKRYIFNLEIGEAWHPVVGDAGLAKLKFEGKALVRDGREVAVFCWIKSKLDAHVKKKFSTFQPDVAQFMRQMYLSA